MIRRKTQDLTFWRDEFTVTSDDLQHVSSLLIEDELPRSTEELARAIVRRRCQLEEALVRRAMASGKLYRPSESYGVGERVVFPALGYTAGEVTGMRRGYNPEYGDFQVIQVAFEQGAKREFAAEFLGDHILNVDPESEFSTGDELLRPEQLADLYGPLISERLDKRLEDEPSFVRLAGEWFRRDLLVEVHIGHLNLAEAVLDIAGGGPLPTEDLLGDLELPDEVTPQLRIFSLNYALQEDPRFDEVGPAGEVLWYLSSLEPENVQIVPDRLQYRLAPYDPDLLTSEMVALEQHLHDEWSEFNLAAGAETETGTVVLTYPHWRSGTLPYSSGLRGIFPTGRTQRIHFTFVDSDTGEEMPGWVLREGRYVSGLADWYRSNDVPVGAYLDLARGDRPGVVVISRRGRRSRREWMRVVLPVEGRLTFEMRKHPIACEYDELMGLAVEEQAAVDALAVLALRRERPLAQIVAQVFPELAKLSPQGSVHASTLYSAVNVVKRVPPGPLFAELVAGSAYMPVGDNYWVLTSTPSGD
ncbi:MAG: hypothetical protein GX620_16575 [Chloroflexi bacterium]|nr:hypothetical protein [Chloroflexota bacterium]